MEIHVALVAIAHVLNGIDGPHVGFGKQHLVFVVLIQMRANFLQISVRFRKVFAVGAVAFKQVGHGIQAEAIDTHVGPEVEDAKHGAPHGRVVVIQIGLVGIEAVPVIRFGYRVIGPVRCFKIGEDDARALVLLRRIAPNIVIAPG